MAKRVYANGTIIYMSDLPKPTLVFKLRHLTSYIIVSTATEILLGKKWVLTIVQGTCEVMSHISLLCQTIEQCNT